ncbi:MAG: c-type cytochrome [Hydrogenovibrio sp.]|nr:c-type cytochrome [Hydrogenovibrio sp.]
MKKLLVALATTGVVFFGATAQAAGNAAAGEATFATCAGCHGADAHGGVGPKLAGLPAKKVVELLHKYKNGEQMGPMTSMMAPMAAGLSDSDIENVAAYVSGLK